MDFFIEDILEQTQQAADALNIHDSYQNVAGTPGWHQLIEDHGEPHAVAGSLS